MITKFVYKNMVYPLIIESNESYEKLEVLIPEPTGDYFLAIITSEGGYELLEEIASSEVDVLIK